MAQGRPDGLSARQIASLLPSPTSHRTLQFRLKRLVADGRLEVRGPKNQTRYFLPPKQPTSAPLDIPIPLTQRSKELVQHLDGPLQRRSPVGYRREFLESYCPNSNPFLDVETRNQLESTGRPKTGPQAAGTFAKQIAQHLLIDLSWNSSRLEGNTYTLLDTHRLIELGAEAEGRGLPETQMILNHKDAISFLIDCADEIGFNRYTICNLHAMLADNLLADTQAAGRLRRMPVGIEGSVFHPLEVPQLVEEVFDQILATATAIDDPFEQSLFTLVHLPYLQPFDDVNKRVSRLAANIPLIKANLSPLSFTDVPRQMYTKAMLAIYELNDISLLRDLFRWSYTRSAARYASVRQSLGEPDPFRLLFRDELRDLVGGIVRGRIRRGDAGQHIEQWMQSRIAVADRERFREAAEHELLALNRQNLARFRVRPSEFDAWWNIWIEEAPPTLA